MKKIIAFAGGAALLLASCSKESTTSLADSRMKTYSQSEIAGQLKQENRVMNVINGKTNDLSFILRAVAEPPIVGGTNTKATSVSKVGNKVYVTWHTVNAPYGGTVSIYDVGTPGAITYEGRLDFIDTDFHQAYVDGTSSLFLVGQRDPNSGAYDDLVGTSTTQGYWRGAIFGKLALGAGGSLTTTYTEVPLGGFAANGLANNGGVFDVVTGDEDSKIYRVNGATMTVTDSSTGFQDGEFITTDGTNMYALDGDDVSTDSRVYVYSVGATLNSLNLATVAKSVTATSKNLDRSVIAVDANGNMYCAMGGSGVFRVDNTTFAVTNNYSTSAKGGTSQGISVDNTNGRLYIAQGEQGLFIADLTDPAMAQEAYAEKVYPNSNYKDVTYVAATPGAGGPENWLFIADGERGLLLVEEVNP